MTYFKVFIAFILLSSLGHAQEIEILKPKDAISISSLFEKFQTNHKFNFSFDADAIKDMQLKIDRNILSIDELKQKIRQQTKYLLKAVNSTSYILVQNDTITEVCGVVVDAITSFELTQADISNNKAIIDITDKNGFFNIKLTSLDTISISYLGYNTKVLNAKEFSSTCDTIFLQPKVENLNQIIIREYLTTGIQKNEDASVKISTKKLKILPGLVEPDVFQSLQLLPGINSPNEDPAGLHIRGGTPDQNLVLWDGIKVYHTGHLFNQVSSFNPYIVESVNVYRGGTSVRYGDRLSGVIEIESDNDLTEELKIGGGLNLTHGDLFIKMPLSEKAGIMLAGRRSSTDIYQNITSINLLEKVFQNTRVNVNGDNPDQIDRMLEDDLSYSDSNFKFIWLPNDKNTFKISSLFAENRLNTTRNVESLSEGKIEINDIFKLRNFGSSINWTSNFKNGIIQKTSFYASIFDQRYRLGANFIDSDMFIQNDIENLILRDIGGEYSLSIPIKKNQKLGIGYQYAYNETKYETIEIENFIDEEDISEGNINNPNNSHTVYLEYIRKTSKSYLNIGLRNSLLSATNKFLIEPRMFSSFEVVKDFRITASAELKNQQLNRYFGSRSTLANTGFLPVADNIWLTSGIVGDNDLNLPIFRSSQFTLGGLYTYKGWNIDVETYYKRLGNISSINDIILNVASQSNSDDFPIFSGKENRIGVDILIKKRIKNYRFWLGYSLSNTRVKFPDIQNSFYPGNFDQRHVFNISQTLKVNDFEFSLGWNYSSGKPFTKIVKDTNAPEFGVRIGDETINQNRFKDYHRLDASVLYRFNPLKGNQWKGILGVSLRNIYNRRNIINEAFIGREDINFNQFIESQPGESLRFTPDFLIRFEF